MTSAEKKLATKRFNERVKLAVTTINAMAIGIAGSAIILPIAREGTGSLTGTTVIWLVGAIALHIAGHWILGLLRSEE